MSIPVIATLVMVVSVEVPFFLNWIFQPIDDIVVGSVIDEWLPCDIIAVARREIVDIGKGSAIGEVHNGHPGVNAGRYVRELIDCSYLSGRSADQTGVQEDHRLGLFATPMPKSMKSLRPERTVVTVPQNKTAADGIAKRLPVAADTGSAQWRETGTSCYIRMSALTQAQ